MIFEETLEDEDNDHMYVFGGGSHNGLYRFKIEWSPEGRPTEATLELEGDLQGEPIIFRAAQTFHPNIPNKKYLPELKTWIFVDNNRNYYTYNTVTKAVTH